MCLGCLSMTNPPANTLEGHLDTPIKLFIADRNLLIQVKEAVASLGFKQVGEAAVNPNYFQASRQLYGEVVSFDGLVLVNHPPQRLKDSTSRSYEDPTFADFYKSVASFNKSSRRQASDFIRKCIPVFTAAQDADIRQRIIEDLFPYGIIAVFMLNVQPMGLDRRTAVDERIHELDVYLSEFFLQQERKLTQFKEFKSAEDLRERRKKSEELLAKVQELKSAGQYDKAIALCREAAEVLPTDPEPYLEGGRLLVKKRKYPPAMQMFQDAEKVAEDLPAPNQEIGNLRVAQVNDYVEKCKQAGTSPDQEKISGYLNEALENYETALGKADSIKALSRDSQEEKRQAAALSISDAIMTSGLSEALGEQHPMVAKLGLLAGDTLNKHLPEGGEMDPRYLVQFALMAFMEGKVGRAVEQLEQAAQNPETFDEACQKLNFIGTQLRQRTRLDEAVDIYQRLLKLGPSFKGVVLFNLAVAKSAQLAMLPQKTSPQAKSLERQAMGIAVEALYVDPLLPGDKNFYANRVIAPILEREYKVFGMLAAQGEKSEIDRQCSLACKKLEDYLDTGDKRNALQYMYGLTGTLRPFFLEFDRHASEKVMNFADSLRPILAKSPKPGMQIFGKVLDVLVSRGKSAQKTLGAERHPAMTRVFEALNRADQAGASRELALALATQPDLVKNKVITGDETLANLSREIVKKLSRIEFGLFNSPAG